MFTDCELQTSCPSRTCRSSSLHANVTSTLRIERSTPRSSSRKQSHSWVMSACSAPPSPLRKHIGHVCQSLYKLPSQPNDPDRKPPLGDEPIPLQSCPCPKRISGRRNTNERVQRYLHSTREKAHSAGGAIATSRAMSTKPSLTRSRRATTQKNLATVQIQHRAS